MLVIREPERYVTIRKDKSEKPRFILTDGTYEIYEELPDFTKVKVYSFKVIGGKTFERTSYSRSKHVRKSQT